MKVLIVDDTPMNLRLLRAVLEGEGMSVVEARDGVEALAILEQGEIEAIISDILMPNMDGYRFCNEVRRNSKFGQLPFIMYSSTYNSPTDAALAIEMGADRYLKKPAPVEEICAALADIVKQGPNRRAHARPPLQELTLAKLYNATLVTKLEDKNMELILQESALRDSEEKFRQLAENIKEVCWISTAADPPEILYVSPHYEKVYGRSCESLRRNPMSILEGIPADEQPQVIAAFSGLRRGADYDIEHRVVRPDGKTLWVHAQASAIRNDQGKIYRLAGIIEDITARKATEAQLRQAQKMEAIGQLAGGVAHDFNNLLMIIGANVELLLMGHQDLPTQAREYLSDIADAATRAVTLTRQLLSFSRSEAARMEVLDLNKLIATFTKLLSRVLGESITVRTKFDSTLQPIKCDRGMIEQILMNLAVNARDAMPEGGQLTIRTEDCSMDAGAAQSNPRARSGRFACLIVEDKGTGISPEHMARIFEPFFTTKGVGKGTGLGLATVFSIAEQHAGWVDVSSELGAGTKFKVYLPMTGEQLADSEPELARHHHAKGERLLVAEDDISVRRVVVEILQRQGYTVMDADSGAGARQIWQEQNGRFDLLVTDMIMSGGMTGLELTQLLRAEKPALKVILTSGYSDELMTADSAIARRLTFLKKPFTPQKLTDTVRECLDSACHGLVT